MTLSDILAANAQFGPLDLDKVRLAMADSDRENFERERLVSLIIDVGMLRRDVATDVADAILKRWTLQSGVDRAVWEQAYQTDTRNLREKLADVHRLLCSASAKLAGLTAGDLVDADGAFSDIQLALRRAT